MKKNKSVNLSKEHDDIIHEHGFIIHGVEDNGEITYHTHGILEKFDHMDLELVISIEPKIACAIIHTICDEIKKGKKFQHGLIEKKLFLSPITFINAQESGRNVLRIVIPEPSGSLKFEEMTLPDYKSQYLL